MRTLSLALVLVPAVALAEPTPVTSLEQVHALCQKLSPPPPKGEPLAREQARSEAKAARDEAMKTELALTLKPGEFRIADADAQAGTLTLDTQRAFRFFKSQVVFYPVDEDDLDLAVPEGGTLPKSTEDLTLQLVVRPAQDSEQACTIGKAKDYVIGIEVLSAKLVNKAGAAIASLEEDPSIERAGKSSGTPSVEVTSALVEGSDSGSKQLAAAAKAQVGKLDACYREGIGRKPALDGTLVVGFELGKDGKPGEANVVADSVQDDAVVQCAVAALAGVHVERAGAKGKAAEVAARASVTLDFERR